MSSLAVSFSWLSKQFSWFISLLKWWWWGVLTKGEGDPRKDKDDDDESGKVLNYC